MSCVERFQQIRQRGSLETTTTLDDALGRPSRALAVVVFHRYQSRNRPAAARDGETLAPSDPVQEPGQVRLCFVGADTLHCIPRNRLVVYASLYDDVAILPSSRFSAGRGSGERRLILATRSSRARCPLRKSQRLLLQYGSGHVLSTGGEGRLAARSAKPAYRHAARTISHSSPIVRPAVCRGTPVQNGSDCAPSWNAQMRFRVRM